MDSETPAEVICPLCNHPDSWPIKQDPRVHICQECGFVYVPGEYDAKEVAAAWTAIYRNKEYDPNWPGVRARLFYVAEWLDQNLYLRGKNILDIGAGNGKFMEFCRDRGAHCVGLEPDKWNHDYIRSKDFFCFHGAVEDFHNVGEFDIVTINWTLENCADFKSMLRFANGALHSKGILSVATGSRILVPYKKPLSSYLAPDRPAELHRWRWSEDTLTNAGLLAGFRPENENDYEENDVLLMTFGKPAPPPRPPIYDDPIEVRDFFEEWGKTFP